MVCAVCGHKGHNIRGCSLPGAKLLLSAQKGLADLKGTVQSPQRGRKPPRLGTPCFGKRKRQAQQDYSGPHQKKLRRDVSSSTRRKVPAPNICNDTRLEAVQELQRLGFLTKTPKRCSECRCALGRLQVRKKRQADCYYVVPTCKR